MLGRPSLQQCPSGDSVTRTEHLSAANAKYPPRLGHTLQVVFAEIEEFDVGSGDEVCHGARDQYLAWLRKRHDALSDMDRDASEIVSVQLDLARVQT